MSRTRAASANSESIQLRFRSSRISTNFFMTDMDPFDFSVSSDRIVQLVQAVAATA